MSNLFNLFLNDGKKYADKIINYLIDYEDISDPLYLIEEVFRAVHSIKTEAQYLQFSDISELAHEIEDDLESIRSGVDIQPEKLKHLIKKAEELKVLIENMESDVALEQTGNQDSLIAPDEKNSDNSGKAENINPENSSVPAVNNTSNFDNNIANNGKNTSTAANNAISANNKDNSAALEVKSVSNNEDNGNNIDFFRENDALLLAAKNRLKEIKTILQRNFTDKETELICNSLKQGMQLYRIVCEISPESLMKYPRLYLIVSNLELNTNLIKTMPSLEKLEEEETTTVICYITSEKTKDEIYSIVNVDEIEKVSIINFPYTGFLKNNTSEHIKNDIHNRCGISKVSKEKFISVKTEKINSLYASIHDIMMWFALKNNKTPEDIEKLFIDKLRTMEKNIADLRTVSLQEEFFAASTYLKQIAYSKNKKIDFIINDNNIQIDRIIYETIYDSIMHILKNSVEHGIESEKERIDQGKSCKGKIELNSTIENNFLVIEIKDDGTGIDLEEISILTNLSTEELLEPGKLASVLTAPGFTTKSNADTYSGRGFGMNLVGEKIRQFEGAFIEIDTKENSGTSIKLKFPDTCLAKKVMFFSFAKKIFAINEKNIDEIIDSTEDFLSEKNGKLLYKEIPLFSAEGFIYSGKENFKKYKAIIIKDSNGNRGAIPAEKILFSNTVSAGYYTYTTTDIPYIFSMGIENFDRHYSYIDTSLLFIS